MTKESQLKFGMRCVKYMLFVANFMFVLVGFLLISIGSTIKTIYGDFDEFMADHFYSASKLAIAIGIIIFFVALFGCVGALKESVCLVNTYAFLLFGVMILELSVSISSYIMRGNIETTVKTKMYEAMDYYDTYTQYTWNATQYNLRCCGVAGPDDWSKYAEEYNLNNIYDINNDSIIYSVPDTCCREENCVDVDYLWTNGCLNRITQIVSECALLLGVGALCISFIQFLGIIFAHLLARSIRRLKTQITVDQMERRQHIYEQLAKNGNNEKVSPVLYTPTSSEA